MPAVRVGEALRAAADTLGRAGLPRARLEAERLLAHVLGCGRARLLADLREDLAPEMSSRLEHLAARRAAGEPLQYLTGLQEFRGRGFRVDRRVLIPRSETEGLVEEALRRLRGRSRPRIVDVGTGSGCIAVTLAAEIPDASVLAIDASTGALEVARENARALAPGADLRFLAGDLLAPVAAAGAVWDLVVSNPPYVATGEAEALPPEVRDHEPRGALVAGETGLEVIRLLVPQASAVLRPGGALLLEIGFGQWPRVREILEADPCLAEPSVQPDPRGIPRVAGARRC